jgi:hypothetical protein
VTAQDDGGSTRRDDRSTLWCGGSRFNTPGRGLNEIELDSYRHPKTSAEMTVEDWADAAAALRKFDAERGFR